jgi:D-methionine transport system substrate-binding protein
MSNENLIEAPQRSRGPVVAIAAVVVIAVIAAIVFFATRGGDDDKVVKIGVVGGSDPYWATYKDAAKDEGINVEIVDFAEYPLPNPALDAGELDLNQFQHIVFLADYNVSNDKNLVPIGSTAIYPLGLYSTRHEGVDAIPAGGTIAVPDDASNQSRALVILQSAGLIKLKDGGTIFSDLNDVDTDASKVKVRALAADITATSLDDLDGAVINNDFVEKAGLKFSDAIAQDDPADPNSLPYVNIFAARAEDKDNETYKKLVQIFQDTKAVTDGLQDVSGGTAQLLKTPVADLEAALEKVEKDTAATK